MLRIFALDEVRLPAILDEIQNVPEVLNFVRRRIDRAPRKTGQWLLTGSQEAPLMSRRREVYYFRDQQGLEVDLVVPAGGGKLVLVEAKATVMPQMAEPLVRLGRAAERYDVTSVVVHRGRSAEPRPSVVRPGVKAVPIERLQTVLASPRRSRTASQGRVAPGGDTVNNR